MSNYIHAYLNTPITFNPYQYKPLMELRQHPDQNLLISDEVGLGKTIEAGIIIDDLLKANPEARILVICPAFLREKWAMELEEKFYLLPVIFDSSYQPLGERVIILPVSRLSQFNKINGFNLIIVDEIHYFKNRKSRRYSYLQEIINGNPKARRVFMSATPINNTGDDYQSIVKLIGGKHLSTNTTKRQSYIDLKKRNVKDIWIDLSPEEQEIYDTTDELPAFSGTIYRHIGASSLHSLYVYANQGEWTELKNELRSSLDLLAVEEDEEISEYFADISPTIRSIMPETDSKLKELYNVLSQTADSHIVIFTHYIETVKYLYETIRSFYYHIGKGKDNVAYIYANTTSINIPQKNRKNRFADAKVWFDEEDVNRVLICSDSCKEGVDLQIASVLINYDLPFNPSIVEQRIGRIDRTGQLNDMKIYNFHVGNTYDDRLHMILSTKLRLINYYAQYGIGNPLQISEDGSSRIFDGFINYFAKASMSNDDIETTLRMLRKMFKNVPTIEEVKNSNKILMNYLLAHEKKICSWFSEDIEKLEKDDLRKARTEYVDYLQLPDNPGVVSAELSEIKRKEIADRSNSDPVYRLKVMALIKDPESIFTNLEEYGEVKILSCEDIKNRYEVDYIKPISEEFVPYEIISELR